MYKLNKQTSITRLSDNATIPSDPANSDYQEYITWLSAGNTPTPVDPPTPAQLFAVIETRITQHMDEVAQSKKYDNRDSCRLYAGYTNPFQVESIAFGQWVSACWVSSNQAQTDIANGLRTIPTPEEAVAELPVMEWPV